MSSLWPSKPMPPDAAEAWYPLLEDLPGDEVAVAIRAVALDAGNVWPPSVGQLRAACEPPDRPWEQALAELRRLVARHGSYGPTPDLGELDDRALVDLVEAYGWQQVCRLQLSDPAARAQFRDSYRDAQRRERERGRREVAALAGPQRRALSAGGGL